MGDLLRGVDDRAASCSRRWRWDSGAAAADGDGGGDRTKRTRICQCKDEDNLRMIRNCVSQVPEALNILDINYCNAMWLCAAACVR
ncbi:hypothetical protein U9M48_025410 [Paspalum notatum var. saurae]|uniref:Uncharacterized protein n=1 Tax=Paspalum notatum var. saurae TaxID=547442 RepID=A0AAQ3WXX4_PASNO